MGVHLLVNTGGGDAPGLNAAIRAVTLSARRRGFRVTGIRRGYSGLLEGDGLVEPIREAGSPTPADRLLALRYGAAAVRFAAHGRWGQMVSWQPPRMTGVPLDAALERTKRVPLHHDAIQTARDFGISVGD